MNENSERIMAEMLNLLKDTVEDFSNSETSLTMRPLFCVSNYKFELLKTVSYFSNKQVLYGCCQLCIELCNEKGITVFKMPDSEAIDFVIQNNEKKIGICLSYAEASQTLMENLKSGFKNRVIDEVINVILQESLNENPIFYPSNSYKYREYPYKHLIKNITIRQFFGMIGATDYEIFKQYVARYNYEAEQALGLTVSAIPTESALEKHKDKIKEHILSYFYEDELKKHLLPNQILQLKVLFEKNYDVLLSNMSFARSFISSEWYYNLQVVTDVGLEYTAIVAGYLKSIEQLLCSILLSLSDQYEFLFYPNKKKMENTDGKKIALTNDNKDDLLTMANHLLNEISSKRNLILYKTPMTNIVIEYLKKYVDETRNGYMHKDNIYEWEKTQEIRIKTFCAYFMILSTFKIDKEKLSRIKN